MPSLWLEEGVRELIITTPTNLDTAKLLELCLTSGATGESWPPGPDRACGDLGMQRDRPMDG